MNKRINNPITLLISDIELQIHITDTDPSFLNKYLKTGSVLRNN